MRRGMQNATFSLYFPVFFGKNHGFCSICTVFLRKTEMCEIIIRILLHQIHACNTASNRQKHIYFRVFFCIKFTLVMPILGGQNCPFDRRQNGAPACPAEPERSPNGAPVIHVNDIRSEPGSTQLSQDDGSIHKANSLKLDVRYQIVLYIILYYIMSYQLSI